uniref:Uncharacterized protein n=2 Tax=Kalanchoe fedtschenkoi TaxID=63787 RepID=A0A7N0UCX9_KALFE
MSSKRDEKRESVVDRIRDHGQEAARILGRNYAERVAVAARDGNLYGRKEEGPNTWLEKQVDIGDAGMEAARVLSRNHAERVAAARNGNVYGQKEKVAAARSVNVYGQNEERPSRLLEKQEAIRDAGVAAARVLNRNHAGKVASARNVDASGQKEGWLSRWLKNRDAAVAAGIKLSRKYAQRVAAARILNAIRQEKQQAKRQMHLMSSGKAVKFGERKGLKSSMSNSGGTSTRCQKCFQTGHWTYECKNERVQITQPSRTLRLKSPKLRMKISFSFDLDNPYLAMDKKEGKSSKKSKRKHRSGSDSRSDSEASIFETDSVDYSSSVSGSDNSSAESSSESSSSFDSEVQRRRRSKKRKQKKRRRYCSSSSQSDSSSESESDDDRSSRKKSKRRSRRR